jgi:hypothetical protein
VQSPFNAQNYNRYGYCLNNPLTFTDPTGEFIWFVPVIIGAVVGAYIGGSVQQGTAAFWKWDSDFYKQADFWKSVTIGAIVGAGVGAGFSAAFAPGAFGTPAFAATGMSIAGESSIGWSVTSQALLWGNMNMAITKANGGSLDDVFNSGLKGLAAGAAMGAINAYWEPDGLLGYVTKRNLVKNIISLSSENPSAGLSFGPISWNSNSGFSHIFQRNLNIFDRLGMIYETTGMIHYMDCISMPHNNLLFKNECMKLTHKSRTIISTLKGIKTITEPIYKRKFLTYFFHEDQMLASYLTGEANRPTRERINDYIKKYFRDNLPFRLPFGWSY